MEKHFVLGVNFTNKLHFIFSQVKNIHEIAKTLWNLLKIFKFFNQITNESPAFYINGILKSNLHCSRKTLPFSVSPFFLIFKLTKIALSVFIPSSPLMAPAYTLFFCYKKYFMLMKTPIRSQKKTQAWVHHLLIKSDVTFYKKFWALNKYGCWQSCVFFKNFRKNQIKFST